MTAPRKAGAVLVTGAASGIGRAVALSPAAQVYDLVLVDRDEDKLAEVQASLSGANVQAHVGDVTDEARLRVILEQTRDARKPLTAAVTCAGIEVLGSALDLTQEDWAQSLAVNLTGTFNAARAALPELLETKGALVFMASDAGLVGAQGYAAYCAAKHGVIGLMKAMALDLGPRGVRVNAVAPGFVETPMAARIFNSDVKGRDFYQRVVPLGRFAHPGEVAKAVLHLISEDSSYTTGAVYRIDGGSTAGYFSPSNDDTKEV
jgi:NAD(P)-dependent dehydrogenase (short-subunit alcohol dehydrogenase family)